MFGMCVGWWQTLDPTALQSNALGLPVVGGPAHHYPFRSGLRIRRKKKKKKLNKN